MKKIDFNQNWTYSKEGSAALPVDLPHDAMIGERRNPNSPGGAQTLTFPAVATYMKSAFHSPKIGRVKQSYFSLKAFIKTARYILTEKKPVDGLTGIFPFL